MRANPTPAARRSTSAVVVYLVILVSLQVFLITVAVDAFATGDKRLAWASAITSMALAVGSALTTRFLKH